MKVALVLSGIAPRAVDSRLTSAVAAISQDHAVEVWAPPGAVAHLRRRLPVGVEVKHADSQERHTASKHFALRRPRALRKVGISEARLDRVLRGITADLVILPTRSQAERAVQLVAKGTVVLDWLPDLWEESGSLRDRDSTTKLVLAAGPLLPSSRFGDAIRAFDSATEPLSKWRMEIRGSGHHQQGLNDLIEWRSLQERVALAPQAPVETDFGAADVLMVTAPNALPALQAFQAAVLGVPIVGFDDNPVASWVAAYGAGHVVPAGSVDALSAVLNRVMNDEDARARCVSQGRELAQSVVAETEAQRWRLIVNAIARYRATAISEEVPTSARSSEGALALTRGQTHALEELTATVGRELARAKVPYGFVAGSDGRRAMVIGVEHRTAAVQALLRASEPALGGALVYVGRTLAHHGLIKTVSELPEFMDVVDRIRVVNADRAPEVYLDLELWSATADGVRIAPRPNREANAVDDATWASWLESPSRTVAGQPLWDDVTFPIDAIFTWVDGADPEWQRRRSQFLGDASKLEDDDGAAPERFLSRDEIYFAVAAAIKNMPWLRRLVVVTDGQQHQGIVTDFPQVEFVDHREIFPDPGVLPVFNSHAIEACLHRLPGLAEHFVYFNDDMIVTRPLAPTDLFAGNGMARFFQSPLTIDYVNLPTTEPHLRAAANNRRLLARDFGAQISHSMLHIPYPHRRSVLEEMEQRYADDFARTRASRFRAGADVSVLSSFAQHYGWLTQRYLPGSLEYRFVRLNKDALPQRIAKVLSEPEVQVVALGEPLPGQERHPNEKTLVADLLRGLLD